VAATLGPTTEVPSTDEAPPESALPEHWECLAAYGEPLSNNAQKKQRKRAEKAARKAMKVQVNAEVVAAADLERPRLAAAPLATEAHGLVAGAERPAGERAGRLLALPASAAFSPGASRYHRRGRYVL
jgi:hypothetical protein